jgi:predicted ArsR family transcriptional regulator
MNAASPDRPGAPQLALLDALKSRGPATIAELAATLAMTGEAVRQHLVRLGAAGFVRPTRERHGAGRPVSRWAIAPDAERLFPKRYEELAVALLDRVSDTLGPAATRRLLASLTEERVRAWEPRLRGRTLRQKLELLKDLYSPDDPHTAVDTKGRELRLVERNCPFLEVALKRPALCSVTVNTLTRLLGVRVEREERFQSGDGRCVFRVRLDQPIPAGASSFAMEPAVSTPRRR